MNPFLSHTGGELATNGYLLPAPEGYLCFDAPETMADFVSKQGVRLAAVILTHGHFDHIWDAQRLAEAHQCPVYAHAGDAGMIRDPAVFKAFFDLETIPPVQNLREIAVPERGAADFTCGGLTFRIFHIPGHSRGSLAFYDAPRRLLIGGDILFAGGVGRWDLPGGSRETLLSGIKEHLLILPPETRVYPGHGGPTTIGDEKATNPYLE